MKGIPKCVRFILYVVLILCVVLTAYTFFRLLSPFVFRLLHIDELSYVGQCVLIALLLLFGMSVLCHRIPAIPLKYYHVMFTLPFFILLCIPKFWPLVQAVQDFKSAPDILPLLCASIIIMPIMIAIFYIFSHLILIFSHSILKLRLLSFIISKAISNCLFILSVGVIIFLIYIQLYNSIFGNSGNNCGSSSSDLAICAAIIAAFATMYNVQRVSKQELTKNRQDWITTVRLETAKIISTFDSFKANYKIYTQFYNTNDDEFISSCKSLVRICTKLRMFLNPGDTIAPMITAQLDAIVNCCNYYINGSDINKASTIQSIDDVDLHKSLMPWVQVLLKAEWERVKDVLESREETLEGFYSEYVYKYEWGKKRLEKYGITVEDPQKDIKDIMEDLFPGFEFYGKDKEDIKEKLEEMGLVDE